MVHSIPKVVEAIINTTVSATCSPGGASVSSTDLNGRILDLRELGRHYGWAVPFGNVSGYESTEADRKVILAVKMQHGDSSGGGDFADYSTVFQAADANFFTSFHTTVMTGSWTTSIMHGQTNSSIYDIRAMKRWMRPVLTPTINFQATSTSLLAFLNVNGGVVFLTADEEPPRANTGIGSTSTTT